MLVLTRRPDEYIVIGGKIKIMVISVRGDSVRLGIDAPPEVEVNRSEIERSKRMDGGRRPRPPDAGGADAR